MMRKPTNPAERRRGGRQALSGGRRTSVRPGPSPWLPGNAKGKNPDTTTFGSGAQVARTVLVGSGDPDVVVTAKVGLGEILVVRPDGTPITDLTATGARS